MTRDEMVAVLANRLGQRTDLNTQIAAELKLAQTVLEGTEPLPWFLLSIHVFSLPATPIGGISSSYVPVDFLREYEDGCLLSVDADGVKVELAKDEYSKLSVAEWSSTKPQAYATLNGRVYVFPAPVAPYAYTFELPAYFKASVLADGGQSNAWSLQAPDLLMAKAGIPVARFLRDEGYVKLFMNDYDEAFKRLLVENSARKEASFIRQLRSY